MRVYSTNRLGVQQGSSVLFSDFADITFSEPFAGLPMVHVSLSMWDFDQKTSARADISAEDVSATGFDLVFKTWADTRVARVRADWMAIGPAADEDAWDV
jgi:hypothetical protein